MQNIFTINVCTFVLLLELDAKLELFLSIQETCSQLDKVVDQYQERMQGIINSI
jgi:hypothetical protein